MKAFLAAFHKKIVEKYNNKQRFDDYSYGLFITAFYFFHTQKAKNLKGSESSPPFSLIERSLKSILPHTNRPRLHQNDRRNTNVAFRPLRYNISPS